MGHSDIACLTQTKGCGNIVTFFFLNMVSMVHVEPVESEQNIHFQEKLAVQSLPLFSLSSWWLFAIHVKNMLVKLGHSPKTLGDKKIFDQPPPRLRIPHKNKTDLPHIDNLYTQLLSRLDNNGHVSGFAIHLLLLKTDGLLHL